MMVQSAYFIIWNSSKRNFDSICSEIEKNTIVKSKKNIEIKKYYNLICDLSEFNNQRELGVYKATKMCNNSKYEIVILDIEFYSKESSDFSFVKTLKKNIRNLYKYKTENYFHDNIIHGTDSAEEYDYVKQIVDYVKPLVPGHVL